MTSGQTYNFSYTYNAAGSLRTEQYPSGRLIETGYDNANRPAWVRGTQAGVTTPYIGSAADESTWVHYWPHGGIYYLVRGNRVWHAGSFNSRLQPTESYESYDNQRENMLFVSCPNWGQHLNPGNLPYYVFPICPEGTFSLQNNGNLRSYQEYFGSRGNSNLTGFSQEFAYDGLNRLATAGEAGGWSRSFSYDAFGNMWVSGQTVIAAGGNTSNVYNAGTNRIENVTFDNAGNQRVVNGNTLAYDAENRQISATEPPAFGGGIEQYLYDGEGRRVAKAGPSATTVYVYDASGQLAAEYTNTPTANLPCEICYFSYDHLGSVRMITDQSGNVVSYHDYLPFGEEIQNGQSGRIGLFAASDSVQQRFTGKDRDLETGLDYFGARYLGSALGRFTSADPYDIVMRKQQADTAEEQQSLLNTFILNPQAWNKYAYGLNNPLLNVDQSGFCSVPSGLQSGQTGICIEAFIAARHVGFASLGLGDNRTFNPFGGTYRIRGDVRIDPGPGGNIFSNSDVAKSSVLFEGFGLNGSGFVALASSPTIDPNGNTNFSIVGQGTNGVSDRFGRFGPDGDISFNIGFSLSPSGDVKLSSVWGRTFPSLEIYSYRQGQRPKSLFKFKEHKEADLTHPLLKLYPPDSKLICLGDSCSVMVR